MDQFGISVCPPPEPFICDVDWGRGLKDLGTGGLYEGYKALYKDPADEQKSGYYTAGDSAAGLGTSSRNDYKQMGQEALNFYGGNYGRKTSGTRTGTRTSSQTVPQGAGPFGGARTLALNAGHNMAANVGVPQETQGPDSHYYGVLDALNDERNNRPGQQQAYFDYMKGQVGGLTNEEQLYNERKSGNDPAAAYQDQRATDQINKQLAARGRFNSGPGVRQVSDYLANANFQRSQQLASLAGGADNSRLGLDNAYNNAASGASGEQSKYFKDLTTGYQNANQSMADTFGHFADEGEQAYRDGQMAKYEAQLAASGVDAATAHQMASDAFGVVGLAVKGKGGGGGGGGGGDNWEPTKV